MEDLYCRSITDGCCFDDIWSVFKEKAYESTTVLYYPAATSELAESVSDRDFMDDAAAIIGQEIMLEKWSRTQLFSNKGEEC